jgi:hypothetical protein
MLVAQVWFTQAARPNWLQRLISWRQLGPYSHVRLALPCQRGFEVLESAAPGGVQQSFTAEILPDVGNVVPLFLTDQQVALVRGWWQAHIGEQYDAVGLVELAIGKASSDKRAWYCSEAVLASLHDADVLPWPPAEQSTPWTLWIALRARLEGAAARSVD